LINGQSLRKTDLMMSRTSVIEKTNNFSFSKFSII